MSNEYAGGANTTKNGLAFESAKDLRKHLQKAGCELRPCSLLPKYNNVKEVWKDDKCIGIWFKQYGLYKYAEANKVNWKEYLSRRLLPDDVFVDLRGDVPVVHIFEKKFQIRPGSADEKIQTGPFKHYAFSLLFAALGFKSCNVHYHYVLSGFFLDPRYDLERGYYKDEELNKIIHLFYKRFPSLDELRQLDDGTCKA